MRTLFTAILIMATIRQEAQTSIGGGFGASTKAGAGTVLADIEFKKVGFYTGITANLKGTLPAYVFLMPSYTIDLKHDSYLSFAAGSAYKLFNNEKRGANKLIPLITMTEYKYEITFNTILFGSLSYTDKTVFSAVGIRWLIDEGF